MLLIFQLLAMFGIYEVSRICVVAADHFIKYIFDFSLAEPLQFNILTISFIVVKSSVSGSLCAD